MSGLKSVTIHTDGGCEGNPGPGGWGVVIQHGEQRFEFKGSEPATTNNRMELSAAIAGLRSLNQPCEVTLWTDSQYVKKGMSSWVHAWKARGWRTAGKQPVKNEDLWKTLDEIASRHRVQWQWIKGHAGHPLNERCDELAREAISQLKRGASRQSLNEALARFSEDR
ncbi:MAG: ribonuclease HI [Verrucomicrobia bacterium]|nr:ribonuclease HI [Verrucomicrobiota bacterium]MBI3870051.1 ribonuclease HI [Verrucomicrobiota bacterium]